MSEFELITPPSLDQSACAVLEALAVLNAAHSATMIRPEDQPALEGLRARALLGAVSPAEGATELNRLLGAGPSADRALDAIAPLFDPMDLVEIRRLTPGEVGAVSIYGRLGVPEERARLADAVRAGNGVQNIYFGANPRSTNLLDAKRASSAADVVARRTVFMDLDNKDAPPSDPCWTRTVDELKVLGPVQLVQTGNGWHAYFSIEALEGTDVSGSKGLIAAALARIGSDNVADDARIMRLPFTVNLPTPTKRRWGAVPKLSVPEPLSVTPAPARPLAEVCAALDGLALRTGLPGKGGSAGAPVASRMSAGGGQKTGGPAPSLDLLRMALDELPNSGTGAMDRRDWVTFAHGVKGASVAAGIEAEGRAMFVDWSLQYGGDCDEPGRVWDSATPYAGWSTVMKTLERLNPAGWQRVRNAEAAHAYAFAPIDPLQLPLFLRGGAGPQATAAKGSSGTGGKGKAAHLVAAELMASKGLVPFLDPTGALWLSVNGRLCNLKTQAGFRVLAGWLSAAGLDVTGAARGNLVETLEGRAVANPPRAVFYRVGNGGTAGAPEICVNLMNDSVTGVAINSGGWRVVNVGDLPLPLAHREGGLPLPQPVKAQDNVPFMDRLARHIPLAQIQNSTDPNDEGLQQRAAIVTFLVAQFFRVGAVPHLLLSGEQGGGKTTIARRLNGMTDPDAGAVLSHLSTKSGDAFAQLRQSSNVVLDNTSSLRTQDADLFCVLATGGAYSARRLYSDNDRALSSALCSIVFTSVLDTGITRRPDLLNRMLPLSITPMPKGIRRGEAELNSAWDADLPNLLADLFDLLAIGLSRIAHVRAEQKAGRLPPPPRLADVAQLAEAVAGMGMGWPDGLMTQVLNTLQSDAADEQLASDPIAFRVRTMLQQQPGGVWQGSTGDLESALAFIDGPPWGQRGSFSHGLSRVKGPLREHWGIEINDLGRKNDVRPKEIRFAPKQP